MEIINKLLPDSAFLQLTGWQIDDASAQMTLALNATQAIVLCPLCQQPSRHIHSHYERTLADLAWADYSVRFLLRVRKFFCYNGRCERQVFTERLRRVAAPWARRTQRQANRLTALGLALGGAPGARLSQQLRIGVSRNTLLKLVRQATPEPTPTPRFLGVDDFAFRRRKTYGTVLIDLARSRPVALLPDREAETLSAWLKAHPGVQVISRDRAKAYKKGARQGAPQAIQVADRFHLMQNLAETLDKVFVLHAKAIAAAVEEKPIDVSSASSAEAAPSVTVPPPPIPEGAEARIEQRQLQRKAKFDMVWRLRRQGLSGRAIAQQLGIGTSSVFRYWGCDSFPARRHRSSYGRSKLNPYKAYLRERWNGGCREALELFRAIQAQGYRGSYVTVARYVRRLRQAQGLKPRQRLSGQTLPAVVESETSTLTPRGAVWLVLRHPKKRRPEDEPLIARLKAQHEALAEAVSLAQAFADLLRNRCPEQLDAWLAQAADSSLAPFRGFAESVQADYDAVKAGVTLPWSNGPVEGHINRLKMIKRSMYGRAKLDLLDQRFRLAA